MIRLEDYTGRPYEQARRSFRWPDPGFYNIAIEVCDRWAAQDPHRPAIFFESEDGATATCTYGALRDASNRLANALRALGIDRGDRVAVVLHQRVETAVSHIAVYKLGAVAVPLTRMFGPDALAYRLEDSGAKVAIVDPAVVPKLASIVQDLPALEVVIVVPPFGSDRRTSHESAQNWGRLRLLPWAEVIAVDRASSHIEQVSTGPDDPALIIYTSGTTGPPKGALHGHRLLMGHLPAFQLYFDFVPKAGAVYWTPADWAWIGGSYDLLFPALHFGGPALAYETTHFDPEKSFHLIAKYGVTHAFLPPTVVKMMMHGERVGEGSPLRLQAIMSGGEPVNPVILEWAKSELPGVLVHEIYGQTEANLVCGNCSRLFPVRPGSLGKAYPGHEVTLVGEDGSPVKAGDLGEIAVRGPGDAVVFKGYWKNPQATADKYHDEWLLTGDMARQDDEGYFYFDGRKDDVINSAGYRIGPAEIESSLLTHKAVAEAAAVGVPDPVRGQIVKAFVKLGKGYAPSATLAEEIQQHVKSRLAAYAYPRAVEFVEELPLTTTGKIRRSELRARENSSPTAGVRGC